ncbi:MAG: hypothetical protein ACJZ49_02185 [Candidatus Thalassarchaeaceae archaeon]|nr:MAG: hypothetical protein CMA04_005980 [Euryarchaeota archaeon]|tara:strand:+ start:775 stop:2019 length:1245 start_codon:yes stop_codon:yes gene_type:complete
MALLWERTHSVLSSCIEEGVKFAPLPSPPYLFEEMPVVQPKPDIICQQVIGLSSVDKAGFRRIIENYLNSNLPDYVKRSIDEERALDQYIYDSIDMLIDKFLIARISEWFRSGLDCEVPDTDRWWWAVALFVGVSIRRPKAILDDGFHLLESITLGSPPGQWQTKAQKGPHLVDWNGIDDSENNVEIHVDGAIAAAWILDTLNAEKMLIERWWPEIINRTHLYVPLRMNERLNLSIGKKEYLDVHLNCISHLVIQDLDLTYTLIGKLLEEIDLKNLAKMVSISERISFHSIDISLQLIDAGFERGGDAAVIAQSALSALAAHDEQAFLSRVEVAAYHTDIRSKRKFVQSGLRILMQIDPNDSRSILINSLIENDEVSRVRLRRFAIEMCEINPSSKEKVVKALEEHVMDVDWLH